MLTTTVSSPSLHQPTCAGLICKLTAKQVQLSAVMMWSTLQLGFAITCACLPTLSPLLPAISKPFCYIRSWGESFWPSGSQSGGRVYKGSYEHEFQPRLLNPGEETHGRGSPQSWLRGNGSHDRFVHGVEDVRASSRSALGDPEMQMA